MHIGNGVSVVPADSNGARFTFPERVIFEGTNISMNAFPNDSINYSKIKHVEFCCGPQSGQHELVR